MKKKCKHCGVTKKVTEFYTNYPWATPRPYCKECERERARVRYQEDARQLQLRKEASHRRFENLVRTVGVARFYE